jgi:hypothetical protein
MNDSNPAIVQFSSPIRSNVGDFDQSLSNRLADLNNKSRLRFILSTAQLHYLFARDECNFEQYNICSGFLFRIKVADVRAITILHPEQAKR